MFFVWLADLLQVSGNRVRTPIFEEEIPDYDNRYTYDMHLRFNHLMHPNYMVDNPLHNWLVDYR